MRHTRTGGGASEKRDKIENERCGEWGFVIYCSSLVYWMCGCHLCNPKKHSLLSLGTAERCYRAFLWPISFLLVGKVGHTHKHSYTASRRSIVIVNVRQHSFLPFYVLFDASCVLLSQRTTGPNNRHLCNIKFLVAIRRMHTESLPNDANQIK